MYGMWFLENGVVVFVKQTIMAMVIGSIIIVFLLSFLLNDFSCFILFPFLLFLYVIFYHKTLIITRNFLFFAVAYKNPSIVCNARV